MHSFQPSRGRVLFEFACALGIVASCVGAWRQTGASALLLAAIVAGLYGFVRLFDMSHGKPAEAAEPQRIDFEPETSDIVVPMVLDEEEPSVELEEAELVELPAVRTSAGRRSGGSRKGSGRRTKAVKEPEVLPSEMPVEAEAAVPDNAEEPDGEMMSEEDFDFLPDDEPAQSHIAPLFEPEPFARMQRRAFGRRGRL